MRCSDPGRTLPLALALGFATLTTALGACSPRAGTDASPTTGAASGPATASRSPVGIVPTAGDSAGSGVPGPGSGQTAVGGVAGRQDAGGAAGTAGSTPAPTGGDGAASASTKSP